MIGALYIHVPFCARKCAYCDFASAATPRDDPRMDAFVRDRLAELEQCVELGLLDSCKTAYIGGGTPSFLGEKRLGSLVAAIRRACPSLEELTCEANPDSLSDEVLAAVADAGATRLSIGVQSLDDSELCELGRLHTADQAKERVHAAVRTGLAVSVDLMCAIPRQTDDSWKKTLAEAVALGIGHISVYPLAIEEGTPFDARFANDPTPWNDEDVQAARMEEAERTLGAAGFARYEVASYARPGAQCRHNIAYWTGVPYLGLGPGAASMIELADHDRLRQTLPWTPAWQGDAARMRFSVGTRSIADTRNTLIVARDVEFLSAREAWAEDLMLGMRRTCGVAASMFEEARETHDARAVRDDLIARGLIEKRDERLVPTHDGWLLGNELFGALWDLASSS